MGPTAGAAHLPTGIGEGGYVLGGQGHLALALGKEFKTDAWTSLIFAHAVCWKLEDSLHYWHWQPCLSVEF